MDSPLTITSLYPPIALATVINAFAFALMWRGHKAELRAGEPPGWFILFLLAYIGTLGAFAYFKRDAPLTSGRDYFMVAMIGEAFGILVTFGIIRALYYTRGMKTAEVIGAYLVAGVLLALLLGVTFL
jgi:glucan phosphoethanolaminetransferase (alkaline phosphatase superfamily)